MTTWDAGARSISTLSNNGWFSFEIDASVTGVVVGLNAHDASPHYSEIGFGFQFSQGRWRAVRSGSPVTEWSSFSGRERFHVARMGGLTYLCLGTDAPSPQGESFVRLPGELAHTFAETAQGVVFLDCSILTPLDSIYNLEMTAASATCHTSVSFSHLQIQASQTDYALARADLGAMTLSARSLGINSVGVVFDQPLIYAAQGARADALLRFRPMTMWASEGSAELDITAATMVFQPMLVSASGYEWMDPAVAVAFEYPEVSALGQGVSAAAFASFLPIGFLGSGETNPTTNYFTCVLPAVTFSLDAGFDGEVSLGDADSEYVVVGDPEFASIGWAESLVSALTEISFEATSTARGLSSTHLVHDVELISEAEGLSELEAQSAQEWVSHAAADSHVDVHADPTLELSSYGTGVSEVSEEYGLEVESVAYAETVHDLAFEVLYQSDAEASSELDLLGDGDAEKVSSGVADASYLVEVDTDLEHTSAAIATSQYHIKNPGAVAWVMNTETAAASWYSNWQFVDMVQVGNKILAVGLEGLAELGAETDAGDTIDAGVTFGFTDFGADYKKRVSSFWLGYTSDGLLQATVETYGQGYPAYTYEMVPRSADSPRNNRIIPGKGLNARYWRIGINNVDGCAFSVEDISADIVPSARRL